MHFDAVHVRPKKGAMLEVFELEITAKLSVAASKNIQVKLGRYACGIVISGIENRAVFDQINADDEKAAGPERARRIAQ